MSRFAKVTVVELKVFCRVLNQQIKGNKADLIARVEAATDCSVDELRARVNRPPQPPLTAVRAVAPAGDNTAVAPDPSAQPSRERAPADPAPGSHAQADPRARHARCRAPASGRTKSKPAKARAPTRSAAEPEHNTGAEPVPDRNQKTLKSLPTAAAPSVSAPGGAPSSSTDKASAEPAHHTDAEPDSHARNSREPARGCTKSKPAKARAPTRNAAEPEHNTGAEPVPDRSQRTLKSLPTTAAPAVPAPGGAPSPSTDKAPAEAEHRTDAEPDLHARNSRKPARGCAKSKPAKARAPTRNAAEPGHNTSAEPGIDRSQRTLKSSPTAAAPSVPAPGGAPSSSTDKAPAEPAHHTDAEPDLHTRNSREPARGCTKSKLVKSTRATRTPAPEKVEIKLSPEQQNAPRKSARKSPKKKASFAKTHPDGAEKGEVKLSPSQHKDPPGQKQRKNKSVRKSQKKSRSFAKSSATQTDDHPMQSVPLHRGASFCDNLRFRNGNAPADDAPFHSGRVPAGQAPSGNGCIRLKDAPPTQGDRVPNLPKGNREPPTDAPPTQGERVLSLPGGDCVPASAAQPTPGGGPLNLSPGDRVPAGDAQPALGGQVPNVPGDDRAPASDAVPTLGDRAPNVPGRDHVPASGTLPSQGERVHTPNTRPKKTRHCQGACMSKPTKRNAMAADDDDGLDWSRGRYILFDPQDDHGMRIGRFEPQQSATDALKVTWCGLKGSQVRRTTKIIHVPRASVRFGPFNLDKGHAMPPEALQLFENGRRQHEKGRKSATRASSSKSVVLPSVAAPSSNAAVTPTTVSSSNTAVTPTTGSSSYAAVTPTTVSLGSKTPVSSFTGSSSRIAATTSASSRKKSDTGPAELLTDVGTAPSLSSTEVAVTVPAPPGCNPVSSTALSSSENATTAPAASITVHVTAVPQSSTDEPCARVTPSWSDTAGTFPVSPPKVARTHPTSPRKIRVPTPTLSPTKVARTLPASPRKTRVPLAMASSTETPAPAIASFSAKVVGTLPMSSTEHTVFRTIASSSDSVAVDSASSRETAAAVAPPACARKRLLSSTASMSRDVTVTAHSSPPKAPDATSRVTNKKCRGATSPLSSESAVCASTPASCAMELTASASSKELPPYACDTEPSALNYEHALYASVVPKAKAADKPAIFSDERGKEEAPNSDVNAMVRGVASPLRKKQRVEQISVPHSNHDIKAAQDDKASNTKKKDADTSYDHGNLHGKGKGTDTAVRHGTLHSKAHDIDIAADHEALHGQENESHATLDHGAICSKENNTATTCGHDASRSKEHGISTAVGHCTSREGERANAGAQADGHKVDADGDVVMTEEEQHEPTAEKKQRLESPSDTREQNAVDTPHVDVVARAKTVNAQTESPKPALSVTRAQPLTASLPPLVYELDLDLTKNPEDQYEMSDYASDRECDEATMRRGKHIPSWCFQANEVWRQNEQYLWDTDYVFGTNVVDIKEEDITSRISKVRPSVACYSFEEPRRRIGMTRIEEEAWKKEIGLTKRPMKYWVRKSDKQKSQGT